MTKKPENGSAMPDGKSLEEQPRWRHDFPIDTAREAVTNRREFLKFMVIASGAFVAGQGVLLANTSKARKLQKLAGERRQIGKTTDLAVGQATLFNYPGPHDPCLLIRKSEGDAGLVAYSQRCTHLACPVQPNVEENELFCPCHNGRFCMDTGRATGGPPKKPLPRVVLIIEGDIIYAAGMEVEAS